MRFAFGWNAHTFTFNISSAPILKHIANIPKHVASTSTLHCFFCHSFWNFGFCPAFKMAFRISMIYFYSGKIVFRPTDTCMRVHCTMYILRACMPYLFTLLLFYAWRFYSGLYIIWGASVWVRATIVISRWWHHRMDAILCKRLFETCVHVFVRSLCPCQFV